MPSVVTGSNSEVIGQMEERLETDRFGVDIVTRRVQIPTEMFPGSLDGIGASHPVFGNMELSKREASKDSPRFWSVVYRYEGFLIDTPTSVYELSACLDQEPVQCHPKFVDVLAGTPAAPLNGAVFIDPYTGKPTNDNDKGIFREFRPIISGSLNPKGGIESFLVPGAEWKEHSFSTTRPTEFRHLGTIDEPSGTQPTLEGRNWILWSHTYIKRGKIYQITTTWKMSTLREWDSDLYTDP